MTNVNMLWTGILVDELVRCGLRHAVVCPGSRSAPLALALRRHPNVKVFVLADERGAGYFALGLAKATGRPVAVATTSGTAAVNLHPAVVEADLARVPLLALTADRPPELVDVGANQAIRQAGLFGRNVRWETSLPLPEARPASLRFLRQTACRAMAFARDGPVHVNLPFREPLAPVADGEAVVRDELALHGRPDGAPFLDIAPRTAASRPVSLTGGRGVVVLGPGAPAIDAHGFPVVADGLADVAERLPLEAALASPRLRAHLKPDWILQLGASPTSRHVRDYLAEHGDAQRVLVDSSGRAWDDTHVATHLVADAAAVRWPQADAAWTKRWEEAAQAAGRVPLGDGWEGPVARALATTPARLLWLGSSLPVRDIDRYATGRTQRTVLANRGASGIDGVLSSAAGAAAAHPDEPALAYVGDLTFLHDLNALAAIKKYAPNLTLVVLDNQGGRIFEHLPLAQSIPRAEFEELFTAGQDLDIGKACEAFGLPHRRVEGTAGIGAALAKMRGGVLQVVVDPAVAVRRRNEHLDAVVAAVDALVADSGGTAARPATKARARNGQVKGRLRR